MMMRKWNEPSSVLLSKVPPIYFWFGLGFALLKTVVLSIILRVVIYQQSWQWAYPAGGRSRKEGNVSLAKLRIYRCLKKCGRLYLLDNNRCFLWIGPRTEAVVSLYSQEKNKQKKHLEQGDNRESSNLYLRLWISMSNPFPRGWNSQSEIWLDEN